MCISSNLAYNKLLKNINSNNRFILGLSGGIDSMALLHLIKNFKDDKRNISINLITKPIIEFGQKLVDMHR